MFPREITLVGCYAYTVNTLYNHALGDHFSVFFFTLTNCDLNMYNHIPYKPLEDYDYRFKTLQNDFLMVE
jgi:hypothetical protein